MDLDPELYTRHKLHITSGVHEVNGDMSSIFVVCEFEPVSELDCTNVLFYYPYKDEFHIPTIDFPRNELRDSYEYTDKEVSSEILRRIYELDNSYFQITRVDDYWFNVKFE